ncbi:hypothetical protein MTR67_039499 [Solanum verrucosum]|uniref:Uncharacterized protein n=1 Tax=Solanum verrucosum TaxID=315347 RepID=A0AAF0ZR86_SOLVR|nr:hypothetical protein MTR67_039499 [Solanum verrucosum]
MESFKSRAIDKALEPHGFPRNFYPTFWDLVNGEIMGTMQYFYDHQYGEYNTPKYWLRGFKLADRGVGELKICEDKMEHNGYIGVMLVVFEVVSSLKVNWRKKSYSPLNRLTIFRHCGILGCGVDKLPTVYLGMPTGRRRKYVEIWDYYREGNEELIPMENSVLICHDPSLHLGRCRHSRTIVGPQANPYPG